MRNIFLSRISDLTKVIIKHRVLLYIHQVKISRKFTDIKIASSLSIISLGLTQEQLEGKYRSYMYKRTMHLNALLNKNSFTIEGMVRTIQEPIAIILYIYKMINTTTVLILH